MRSDSQEIVHTRTISREHSLSGRRVQQSRTMSGLDYLKAMQEGLIPLSPISVLMDMKITEVSEGGVVFSPLPAEYPYNPLGTEHGGLNASILNLRNHHTRNMPET